VVPFFPLGQSGVKPTPNTRLFPRFHSSGAERGGLGSYRKVQKGLTLTIKTLSVDENKNNHVLLGSVLEKMDHGRYMILCPRTTDLSQTFSHSCIFGVLVRRQESISRT